MDLRPDNENKPHKVELPGILVVTGSELNYPVF